HHLHPRLREVPRHREPDAVGATGHDRGLPLYIAHKCSSTGPAWAWKTTEAPTAARGSPMSTIRYGGRAPEAQRNREVEAVSAPIWSTAVTVIWETDPDVIRQVLPQPLEVS